MFKEESHLSPMLVFAAARVRGYVISFPPMESGNDFHAFINIRNTWYQRVPDS
jgi:hypothetical protein